VGAAENGWHLSYLLRNVDLEESIYNYSWKYKDPEGERLLAKWNELYASESAKQLNRRNKEFNFIILSGNNFKLHISFCSGVRLLFYNFRIPNKHDFKRKIMKKQN